RLKKHGVGATESFLEAHRSCDLERHLRGVDVVRCTIDDGRLDADDREAREDSDVHRVLETRIDGTDVLTRNPTTGDGVHELVRLLSRELQRLDVELDLRKLTRSTGLLLVRVVVLLDGLLD